MNKAASAESGGGEPTDRNATRNISDGNWTTFFRSFWMRCRITGIARPARPSRKNGVRKDICLPDPRQTLSRRQVAEEGVVEGSRRIQHRVINPIGREPF
jgi:hypothetical protein